MVLALVGGMSGGFLIRDSSIKIQIFTHMSWSNGKF